MILLLLIIGMDIWKYKFQWVMWLSNIVGLY